MLGSGASRIELKVVRVVDKDNEVELLCIVKSENETSTRVDVCVAEEERDRLDEPLDVEGVLCAGASAYTTVGEMDTVAVSTSCDVVDIDEEDFELDVVAHDCCTH